MSRVYLCVCVHYSNVCGFICVWLHTHVHPRGDLMSGIILPHSSTLLTEAGSLNQSQSLPIQLVSLAHLLWGLSAIAICAWNYRCTAMLGLNLGSHACVVSTLPTELPIQALELVLKMDP